MTLFLWILTLCIALVTARGCWEVFFSCGNRWEAPGESVRTGPGPGNGRWVGLYAGPAGAYPFTAPMAMP